MRTGFSCWQLDPLRVVAQVGAAAQALELLVPADGKATAQRWRDELVVARGIEPILTILCLPDRVAFDSERAPLPWPDGLPFVDVLGVRRLRVVGVPGQDSPDAFAARVIRQLRGLIPDVNARGLTLNYENHGEATATVTRILDGIGTPPLFALLDPLNAYLAGEAPEAVIATLLERRGYIHVKDVTAGADGRPSPTCCPVGEGVADWAALLPRLRARGDDFLAVFELPGCGDDGYAGYPRSLAAFRALTA
ncbi:MAG: sugar phosphate isomerase/epimerase [Lentisphaerae bacterium]|nr:sugar phosphate isomerase/epimerase [Lentisphaerota bacterium]